MKNKKLYYKTVNLLLEAYRTGKLSHGNCSSCAVGNICQEASLKTGISVSYWNSLFLTSFQIEEIRSNPNKTKWVFKQNLFNPLPAIAEPAFKLIKETGYSVDELAKIEFAFENSIGEDVQAYNYYTGTERNLGNFIGLYDVFQVLKQIHEVDSLIHDININKLKNICEGLKIINII